MSPEIAFTLAIASGVIAVGSMLSRHIYAGSPGDQWNKPVKGSETGEVLSTVLALTFACSAVVLFTIAFS